jgi:hypothetical protein
MAGARLLSDTLPLTTNADFAFDDGALSIGELSD